MIKPYNLATLTQFEQFCVDQRRIDKTITKQELRQRWLALSEKVETLKCNNEPEELGLAARQSLKDKLQHLYSAMPGAIKYASFWSTRKRTIGTDWRDHYEAQQQVIPNKEKP